MLQSSLNCALCGFACQAQFWSCHANNAEHPRREERRIRIFFFKLLLNGYRKHYASKGLWIVHSGIFSPWRALSWNALVIIQRMALPRTWTHPIGFITLDRQILLLYHKLCPWYLCKCELPCGLKDGSWWNTGQKPCYLPGTEHTIISTVAVITFSSLVTQP